MMWFAIIEIKGVLDIHDFHLFIMDGEYHILATHKTVKDSLSISERKTLKQKVRGILLKDFHLEHVTLELETSNEDCAYIHCVS